MSDRLILFKTRAIADFFGTSTDFVVGEIRAGRLHCSRRYARAGGRTHYVIEFDEVRAYCEVHCQRLIPRLADLVHRAA
jgi:hypothetical protein